MSDNLRIYSWKEIVESIRSPYNTYVFVGKRNTEKVKASETLLLSYYERFIIKILYSSVVHLLKD